MTVYYHCSLIIFPVLSLSFSTEQATAHQRQHITTAVHSTLRNLFRRGSWIISTNLRGFAWTRFLSSSKCSLQWQNYFHLDFSRALSPSVKLRTATSELKLALKSHSRGFSSESYIGNQMKARQWDQQHNQYQYSFKLLAFKSVLIQRDHFLCLRKPSSQFLIPYLCFKVTWQIFCSYKLDFNQNIWKYEMNVNMSSWRIPSWPFVCKWHSWSSS